MSTSIVEISSPEQFAKWDEYVTAHPDGTFLQLQGWAALKQQFDWEYHILTAIENGQIVGGLVLMDRVGVMGVKFSYIPYGPLWDSDRQDVLEALILEAKLESSHSIGLRMEPHISSVDGTSKEIFVEMAQKHGFIASHRCLQPEATLMLNLDSTEEELMAGMRQTTRRYIRKAEKLGLRVEVDTTGSRLDDFYSILNKVDERKKFGVHTLEYYRAVWRSLSSEHFESQANSQPYLFFVYDGDLMVGSYFLYRLGDKSWELYGGVTEEGLQKKANYLLKWEAIRSMKLNGVKNYDQWGVAPINTSDDGSNRHDETHALAGVTYFKEGFGGERVAYVGSWDLPRKKLLYSVARLLKKL